MITLENKVVLITGVGSPKGIGAAVARSFAKLSTKIILNYRSDKSREAVNKLASEIELQGSKVLIIQCDVVDINGVTAMFQEIMNQFGRLDVVVNNAGITKDSLVMRMKPEDFDAVIDVNLKGAFLVARAAVQIMIKQKSGNIINMSSVVGITGNAGQVNYSASKAGLIGMTKSLAKEVAARNIRVNAIAPGFIVSDMTDKLTEAQIAKMVEYIPMKTLGSVEDVASVAVFLASSMSGYMTGQVLSVDGGIAM
ncbi:MAG: 3-oxoacyl-[acyl-carrier-protein] reductase [Culicoidibacterales bacterium]